MTNVIKLHGLPDDIISDRGPQSVSKFWKRLLNRLKIERKLSTARHPETDEQTVRTNQVLEQYLRCYIDYNQDNWADMLAEAEFAYNNAEHSSTKMTPFYANYGFHPRCDESPSAEPPAVPHADERANHLSSIRKFLQHQLSHPVATMKKHADSSRQDLPGFQIGSRVWLRRGEIATLRPCSKLENKLLGPFEVVRVVNPVTYVLRLPPTCRIHNVFHVSQLEPFVPDDFPGRVVPPPGPIHTDDDHTTLFEVEQVLDSRVFRGQLQYLLHWKDYSSSDRSWEPARSLGATDALKKHILEFHKNQPNKPGPLRDKKSKQKGR